ncbi:unnamed protein product [Diplocarpon coronariae]
MQLSLDSDPTDGDAAHRSPPADMRHTASSSPDASPVAEASARPDPVRHAGISARSSPVGRNGMPPPPRHGSRDADRHPPGQPGARETAVAETGPFVLFLARAGEPESRTAAGTHGRAPETRSRDLISRETGDVEGVTRSSLAPTSSVSLSSEFPFTLKPAVSTRFRAHARHGGMRRRSRGRRAGPAAAPISCHPSATCSPGSRRPPPRTSRGRETQPPSPSLSPHGIGARSMGSGQDAGVAAALGRHRDEGLPVSETRRNSRAAGLPPEHPHDPHTVITSRARGETRHRGNADGNPAASIGRSLLA